jgi:hypothetical protein
MRRSVQFTVRNCLAATFWVALGLGAAGGTVEGFLCATGVSPVGSGYEDCIRGSLYPEAALGRCSNVR